MDLFKSFKHEAHPSKSGFDLSRKHVFSTKAGQASPCLAAETVPGDHFEISLNALTRTQTFNTAAFVRGKQRYDFFFVPYSQLWHPFNQFITQRTDKHSSLQKGHIYCPVIELSTLLSFLAQTFLVSDKHSKDLMDFDFAHGAIRLLDLLGYGDFSWILQVDPSDDEEVSACSSAIANYQGKYVNIFRLAAYQHIWYDFYRNKYWDNYEESIQLEDYNEVYTQDLTSVEAFNFDDIDCSTFANSIIGTDIDDAGFRRRLLRLLQPRYIQWKKDLFTSAMPSQQFGAVSAVDITNVGIVSELDSSTTSSAYVIANTNLLARGNSGSIPTVNWSIPSAFDVLSLRKAEALQAWKQNTLRAGNMTDDNFKSHYGVEPYYDADENVHYLGSFSQAIQVNPVETTSQNPESQVNGRVGDIAAFGTSYVQGNKLKFDCKDFGLIMCIASFLPEAEYDSNYLDKANTLHEQFDFFTPEFQNIGLEAVTIKEQTLNNIDYYTDDVNQILGYAPRYYMYKTAVDRVFGEFHDSNSPDLPDGEGLPHNFTRTGTLRPWVAPRADYISDDGERYLKSFYVDPRIFDDVFAINANANQNTDYLIHNAYFDIKAIRPMTVLGLPQF